MTRFNKSKVVPLVALAPLWALLLSIASPAGAQPATAAPDALEIIVPWGEGGGADGLGRVVAKLLRSSAGLPASVVNVPGRTGIAGIQKLLDAPSDGHELIVLTAETFCLLAYRNAGWDEADVIPLGIMMQQPSALFVPSNSRFATWKDIEREARQKPRTLRMAISGMGSPDYLLLQELAAQGIEIVPVPYGKPEQRQEALLKGQADVLYEQPGDVKALVQAKQVRPVLLVGPEHAPSSKTVPATTEIGHVGGPVQFRAIAVKAGTDPARVKMLSQALDKIAALPEFKAFLSQQQASTDGYVPAKDASAFLQNELRAMKKITDALPMHAQFLWNPSQEPMEHIKLEGE